MSAAKDQNKKKNPEWDVVRDITKVEIETQPLVRTVYFRYKKDDPEYWFEEQVSPIYVPPRSGDSRKNSDTTTSDSNSAMAEFQKHWDERETQARTAAKWIATALGAALAALVGTAPLTGFSNKYIPREAYISAAVGLVLIGITLFLVVRVLVPQVTGFGDLLPQKDSRRFRRSFDDLRKEAESHHGVMLPTGIEKLAELGWRADIEAKTLNELAKYMMKLTRGGKSDDDPEVKSLKCAQQQRGRWLDVLTADITQWTSVAAYEVVRKEAWWARTFGLAAGIAGAAAVIVAFTLPYPTIAKASLGSYSIITKPASNALNQALKKLGKGCSDFKGVVTSVNDSAGTVQILVEPIAPCRGGLVTVPIVNLKSK